ncbi:TniQ family protein [Paraburkholderia sp. 32]|uniref:TniQ family protein n=1 Tax=Paraburkholderia sp. 32 TaxID=2991057 RepID=UPI003D217EC0
MKIAGYGTGRIEQLSSFAARAAEECNVLFSDLYRYELFPRFGRVAPNPSRIFVPGRIVIEAAGSVARQWAEALSALTGVSGLELCTALPYDGLLTAHRRFITERRRWCPECLEEMAEGTGPVYEPLAWRLCEFSCCPRHDAGLVDTCPRCGRSEQTSLVSNSRVACCRYCGTWLGRSASAETSRIKQSEIARAKMCEQFLLLPQHLAMGESIASSKVAISALRASFFGGSGSKMARSIGVPPAHVNAYARGDCLAALDIFLRIALVTSTSMRDIFVTREFEATNVVLREESFPVRTIKPKTAQVSRAAVRELCSSIDGGGPISVREAARRANIDPSNIRRWHAALTQRASALYERRVATEAQARKDAFVDKVLMVVRERKMSGASTPTTREMRVIFGRGATLNPWKRDVIAECVAAQFATFGRVAAS